jgi:dienelactone hydrolase
MKILLVLVLLVLKPAFGADEIDIKHFQPPIITDQVPDEIRGTKAYVNHRLRSVYLAPFKPIVPSYNQDGNLLASWNPQYEKEIKPTFVVMHGGHGATILDYKMGEWLQLTFKANILILDSFWSRGRQDNFLGATQFGANMRTLDAIAAGRFVEQQGVDQKNIFLVGGSQGGWTVLRTFTKHDKSAEVQSLYRAGIALYPTCRQIKQLFDYKPYEPRLGPEFSREIIMFTGGKDTATPVTDCTKEMLRHVKHFHYPEGTHAWDIPLKEDKMCINSQNTFRVFEQCRNDAIKEDVEKQITLFVKSVMAN